MQEEIAVFLTKIPKNANKKALPPGRAEKSVHSPKGSIIPQLAVVNPGGAQAVPEQGQIAGSHGVFVDDVSFPLVAVKEQKILVFLYFSEHFVLHLGTTFGDRRLAVDLKALVRKEVIIDGVLHGSGLLEHYPGQQEILKRNLPQKKQAQKQQKIKQE